LVYVVIISVIQNNTIGINLLIMWQCSLPWIICEDYSTTIKFDDFF